MGPQNPQSQYPPPPDYTNKPAPAPNQAYGGDGKQSYEQAFKLEKPKWNDLWAGILVGS